MSDLRPSKEEMEGDWTASTAGWAQAPPALVPRESGLTLHPPAPGPTLSLEDGTDLLEVVSRLYLAPSLETFPEEVLAGLRKLIPFEVGGCHRIDRDHRMLTACYQPARSFLPVRHKEFPRLARRHPLNPLLFANPARAFMLSDVISLGAFLRTELYELLYRPLRVNRELVAVLPEEPAACNPAGFLLISLHRWGSEFTERERTALNLLLPHVARARLRLLAPPGPTRPGPGIDRFQDEQTFYEWTRSASNWRLTRRESDVLFWLSQGKTNAEIGRILGMAERTAETHALRSYPKIGVENRHSAIAMIARLALR